MIPGHDSSREHLPPGRYPATVQEVAAAYAVGAHREELWQDWLDATSILMNAVPVVSVWLFGSYVSPKVDPDDVDCIYWVEDVKLEAAKLDSDTAKAVEVFSRAGMVREELDLRVDTYVVPWVCNPWHYPRSAEHFRYLRDRGYWDDFCMRLRSGAKGATPSRQDALPRRGYLEVMLDGHNE